MTRDKFKTAFLRVFGATVGRKPRAQATPVAVDFAGQVVRCMAPTLPDAKRYPTLVAVRDATQLFGFVPAALVVQKSKAIADGVAAALESLSTSGTVACTGVDAFLGQLAGRLPSGSGARARVETALDLARGACFAGAPARAFLDDPLASKPLGFYTWGEDLRLAFHRDRYLQEELPDGVADLLWGAIRSDDAGLLVAYRHHLRRVQRLSNVFRRPSLLALDEPKTSNLPGLKLAIVPPGDAPENGYPSIADFFAAVRAGHCLLEPSPQSGFYAHQLHALEPLLRPDLSPEAAMRELDADYTAALERLAGAQLFMARETHVKQLEVLAPVMSPVAPVWVRPDIKVEPLPSFYARLADAFRFLRSVVDEGWGAEGLAAPLRRESGPSKENVSDSIDEAIALCDLAARVSRRELEGAAEHAEVTEGRARLFGLWSDADATGDSRGMVPVGVTEDGRVRVLVFAGWEVHTLLIKLVSLPQIPEGARLGGVGFAYPVPLIREAVVAPSALLDRGEVRKLCDEALMRG